MSIQSTRDVTREWAEKRYVEMQLSDMGEIKRQLRAKAASMSNQDLEVAIETTFDNYLIVGEN